MRYLYLLLSILHIFLVPTTAQTQSTLSGVVIDAESKEVLIGATVSSGAFGTITDYLGQFALKQIDQDAGVLVSYVGYVDRQLYLSEIELLGSAPIALSQSSALLETAVITGSRYERKLAESPVSINVINAEIIANTNAQNIDRVLDKIPGVQMLDGQANIRGGSGYSYGAGSRVLLLVDDIPALQGDAGKPYWGDIPVENISQIEIVKGASSSLYGSAALNGIINIRTGYATSEPITKISASYVGYLSPMDKRKQWWDKMPNERSLSLLHKRKAGKFDIVLNAFHSNLDDFFQDSFDKRNRVGGNFRYRLSDRTTIGLNTMFNYSDTADFFLWENGSSGAYKQLPGSLSKRLSTRYYIDPYFTHHDSKGNYHKVLSRYYYVDNDNSNNQSNASDNYYGEYQYFRKFEKAKLNVTSGTSIYHIRTDSELFSNLNINSIAYAGYVQADRKFNDLLLLTLGWRLESNVLNGPENFPEAIDVDGKTIETNSVFRAGVNYEITSGTFLRASYGEGYRFPTITEKYIRTTFSGLSIFPNPNLESETGNNIELGLRQGFTVGAYEGYFDFASFWSRYRNMTDFTFVEKPEGVGFQAQNIGDTDIKGFEIFVGGNSELFSIPLTVTGGYTYIDPTYDDFNETIQQSSSSSENILKYRSKHNFKIDLEGSFKNFGLGAAFNATSHMLAIDALLSSFATIGDYRSFDNDGYRTLDLRTSYSHAHFKLSFLLQNALNEQYTVRPGVLEAPRNFGVRLESSF